MERDGNIIWWENWNGVLTSCGGWALWWFLVKSPPGLCSAGLVAKFYNIRKILSLNSDLWGAKKIVLIRRSSKYAYSTLLLCRFINKLIRYLELRLYLFLWRGWKCADLLPSNQISGLTCPCTLNEINMKSAMLMHYYASNDNNWDFRHVMFTLLKVLDFFFNFGTTTTKCTSIWFCGKGAFGQTKWPFWPRSANFAGGWAGLV